MEKKRRRWRAEKEKWDPAMDDFCDFVPNQNAQITCDTNVFVHGLSLDVTLNAHRFYS